VAIDVLKTSFSASYQWVEEGKPLRLLQQQALKEAMTTLKNTEKRGDYLKYSQE